MSMLRGPTALYLRGYVSKLMVDRNVIVSSPQQGKKTLPGMSRFLDNITQHYHLRSPYLRTMKLITFFFKKRPAVV